MGAGESGTAGRQAGDKRLRIRDQDGKGSDNSHGKPSRADQDFHHSRPACQHRDGPAGDIAVHAACPRSLHCQDRRRDMQGGDMTLNIPLSDRTYRSYFKP